MNRPTIISNAHQFIDYFIYSGISIDEKRRRHLLVVLNIVNLFICGMFTVTSYRAEGIFSPNTLMPLVSTITSVFLLFAIRLVHRIGFIFCSSIFFYLTAVLYTVAIGADNGNTYIWLYPFPMFTYFMVGHHQGKFYVLGSWMGAALLMWLNLDTQVYSIKILLTFITSYALTWILAHSIEQSRGYYYHQMQMEKIALEAALNQVKMLQTLLPICASCKKIRDDGGYWHQVESYIHEHAGIEFSHSICPDCRLQLYSSVQQLRSERQSKLAA